MKFSLRSYCFNIELLQIMQNNNTKKEIVHSTQRWRFSLVKEIHPGES